MNMNLINKLLCLGALLIAGQVSAATISVNPAVNNVQVGDTFTLTVSGDFSAENGTFGGGVVLSWDTAQVVLASDLVMTRAAIEADLSMNNWILPNAANLTVTAASVSVDVLNFGGVGSVFDIFSLDLTAVPPPLSGPINILASDLSINTNGWDGLAVNFVGAQVNVSAVPVPATVWLLGSGLLGLVGMGRSRKVTLA